jgi:AMMECR1 domain-containing protein
VTIRALTGAAGGGDEERGELRGCCGRLTPHCADLHAEVAELALSAAREDPRFSPVRREELARLHYELSLLGPLRAIESEAELDPAIHGVVVRAGQRRGVLLPAIPGVETAAAAIKVARRKGRIAPGEAVELFRFEVRKVTQPR